MPLCWGIISTSKNSHDFVRAVQSLPNEDHQVTAVATISEEDASHFAETHKIPTAYGNHLELAKDEEVDAVYIGNSSPDHFIISKIMLENDKHVLCAKPMTINTKDTGELIDMAQQKGLFLMEAFWSRCSPVFQELQNCLTTGKIGQVEQITVDYGIFLENRERINMLETGESALMDIGVNALQLSQFIFRYEKPIEVIAAGNLNMYGSDNSAGVILIYPEGKISVISFNTRVKMANRALIYGTKGSIEIPDFWGPCELKTATGKYCFALPKSKAIFNDPKNIGLAYAAEETRHCIQECLSESPKMTHGESLELADLVEVIRKQIGIVFPQDVNAFLPPFGPFN